MHPLVIKLRLLLLTVAVAAVWQVAGFWAFYSLTLVVFGLMMPVLSGAVCVNCTSGTSPTQVQLDVSNYVNNLCGSCTSLNGTYVLDITSSGGHAANCFFTKAITPPCTGYDDWECDLLTGLPNSIIITTNSTNDKFEFAGSGSFDCSASHTGIARTSTFSLRCNTGSPTVDYTPIAPFN